MLSERLAICAECDDRATVNERPACRKVSRCCGSDDPSPEVFALMLNSEYGRCRLGKWPGAEPKRTMPPLSKRLDAMQPKGQSWQQNSKL